MAHVLEKVVQVSWVQVNILSTLILLLNVNNPVFFIFSHRTLHGVDTNGLVQKALNASSVHENIINYIQEATKASVLALNTTQRVNDVS